MKIQKYFKIILSTIALTSIIVMLSAGESSAALQANQNTQYTKKAIHTSWVKIIRQMEAAGGTMGLTETLNSDLTPTTSNNIDVHMVKSTEYGAVAILSASGYGNPSNNQAITTTTGNNTGVILNTNHPEGVAGGYYKNVFANTNDRYYNAYTDNISSAKIGDALGTASTTNPGCNKWHSASSNRFVSHPYFYLLRGRGGIFSFGAEYGDTHECYSRGVAVCGTGM